ncbi:MAG: hypothetical protein ACI4L9_05960 [Candidatus Coproplasma sp.]
MKYISDTFKYLKSNLLLLPALAVAMIAFAPIFDFGAFERIAASYSDGHIADSYTVWLRFFLPVNTENWLTVLLSLLGYVVLVIDLSFIQSLTDKHVRFGTKSFRSIMSSFTVNFSYGLLIALLFAVLSSINAFLLAAIMKTFSMPAIPYLFICGVALCAVVLFAELFAFSHFALWLPCIEITGFKTLEALSYSYSLARPVRWKIAFTITLPSAASVAVWFAVAMTCPGWIACIVCAALCGFAFVYVSTACYLVYVDREGIEREDLKKY